MVRWKVKHEKDFENITCNIQSVDKLPILKNEKF